MNTIEAAAAVHHAHSLESRDAWEGVGQVEWIFSAFFNGRIYDMYTDAAGDWWYTVYFKTPDGRETEKQHIFGRKKKKRKSDWFKRKLMNEVYNPRG